MRGEYIHVLDLSASQSCIYDFYKLERLILLSVRELIVSRFCFYKPSPFLCLLGEGGFSSPLTSDMATRDRYTYSLTKLYDVIDMYMCYHHDVIDMYIHVLLYIA